MSIGIIVFLVVTFLGVALSQGNTSAALTVFGYFLAFVCISILLVFGCVTAYTMLVHHLWNM